MSGSAGGAIVGGLLLVAAIPVALTAAVVVGTAAGIGAIGISAAKAGESHHRKTQLELENVSAEARQLYHRLQGTIEQQRSLSADYDRKFASEMTKTAAELREAIYSAEDAKMMEQLLKQATSNISTQLNQTRRAELARIRMAAQEEALQQIKALNDAVDTKAVLVDWKSKTATALAGQKAFSASLLRDAKATIDLIKALSASADDAAYSQRVRIYEQSYHVAEQAMEAGAYQSAAASAQTIVTNGARLALEYEIKASERDSVLSELTMRLASLDAEMESMQQFKLNDAEDCIEEYLDDFVQGRYSELQAKVRNLLDEVRGEAGASSSVQHLQLLLDDVENNLVPEAEALRTEAHNNIVSYYERLRALEIIGDYMQEQGYQIDWAQTAGDDASRKLVVRFLNPVTQNAVSVSMDRDATVDDISRMAMEVMFYYGDGRTVTEDEKESLRKQMMASLHNHGLSGHLACTGSVNREADDKTMNSQEAVRKMPADATTRVRK